MRFHNCIISRDITRTSTLGTIQYQKVLFFFGSICITWVILSEVKGERAFPTVLICLYMLKKKKEEVLNYRKTYKWSGVVGAG